MADSKTITFKTNLDNSALEQDLAKAKQMIDKLNTINKSGQTQYGGEFGKLSKEVTTREADKTTRDLKSAFADRLADMKREKNTQEDINKQLNEYNKIKEKSNDILAKEKSLREQLSKSQVSQLQHTQGAQTIYNNLSPEARKDLAGGAGMVEGSGGTGGGPPGGALPQAEKSSMLANIIKMIGPAAIINGAVNLLGKGLMSSQNIFTNQGQANATMYGQLQNQMQAGNGSDSAFFMAQQQKAAQMTQQTSGRGRVMDWAKIGGATLGGAITGGKIGALGGGAGAVPGAVLGGLAGFGSAMMSSDKLYSRVFDQEQYQSIKNKEDAERYQANLQAAKMQDVRRTMGFEYAQKNRQGFMGLQRATGMGDKELTGSLLKNNTFTTEATMSGMGNLLQAGAGSNQVSGNVGTVLGAQRGLGQGNAAGVLGRILGAGGNQNQYVNMLAQSGLQGSPMEMSRYAEIASQVATNRGGFSESASNVVTAGMMGTHQQAIQAAGGAANEALAKGRGETDVTKALGYSFLRSKEGEKHFGNIKDPKMREYISKLTPQELESNPGMAGALARSTGMKEEDIVKGVAAKSLYQQTTTKTSEKALTEFTERTKNMSGEEKGKFFKTDEGADLALKLKKEMGWSDKAFSQKTGLEQLATAGAAGAIGEQGKEKSTWEQFKEGSNLVNVMKSMKIIPDTMAEGQQAADAVKDQAGLKNFIEYSGQIKASAEQMSESSVVYQKAMDAFIEATSNGATGIEEMVKVLDKLNPEKNINNTTTYGNKSSKIIAPQTGGASSSWK